MGSAMVGRDTQNRARNTMSSVYFDPELSDEERRQRLYAGDIVILSATPGTKALVSLAKEMLEEAFAPHDPRKIHKHMTPEQVAAVLSDLKPSFIHHPECKKLISTIMSENGVALDKLYFDVPRLRSAYPSHFLSSGIAYAFHPHRDTWYSAPMCQINWWLPIYQLDANNSMGFYPRYYDQAVKNNSDIYNYYEWNTKNRATASQHIKEETREQPKPQQELDPLTIRYLPAPGGVIVFSGAQLHETAPNTTDLVRYSIDFRTVHLDDVVARRGAPNIDSRSTGTTMRDYLRASDLQHLPEEIVRLYDDGTATVDQVLYFGDRLKSGVRLIGQATADEPADDLDRLRPCGGGRRPRGRPGHRQ
jgi:hypothetical protein